MNYKEITGSLSKPSKMPGHAYGLPAKECKTGSKLAKVEGSTCSSCYALKGCYVFKVVQAAQYKRLEAIRHPGWVRAMAAQISAKRSTFFRWHDSGDVQNLKHLLKIFKVCTLTPGIQHWMPTREAWVKKYLYCICCALNMLQDWAQLNRVAGTWSASSSDKLQASSNKLQATSVKLQAASDKLQASSVPCTKCAWMWDQLSTTSGSRTSCPEPLSAELS